MPIGAGATVSSPYKSITCRTHIRVDGGRYSVSIRTESRFHGEPVPEPPSVSAPI